MSTYDEYFHGDEEELGLERLEREQYLAEYYDEEEYEESLEDLIEETGIQVPVEMYDFKLPMIDGAIKHGGNNWLEKDGKKSSFKEMHDSMFHHLSESLSQGFSGKRGDKESGRDPLLHLACRSLMMYTRIKRNLKHSNDE